MSFFWRYLALLLEYSEQLVPIYCLCVTLYFAELYHIHTKSPFLPNLMSSHLVVLHSDVRCSDANLRFHSCVVVILRCEFYVKRGLLFFVHVTFPLPALSCPFYHPFNFFCSSTYLALVLTILNCLLASEGFTTSPLTALCKWAHVHCACKDFISLCCHGLIFSVCCYNLNTNWAYQGYW